MSTEGGSLGERLREAWFTFDRRSIALGRMALALMLLGDLARRIPSIPFWYLNDGVYPSKVVLQKPVAFRGLSIFWGAMTPGEVGLCFAITGFVYLGLLVGWHTKLFHVLSFIFLTSLHWRVGPPRNGGDGMICVLTIWTIFLPMGDRFSIDALLRSFRVRRESTVLELGQRPVDPSRPASFQSLAVFGVLGQLSITYVLNALAKTGPLWKSGTILYYVFYNERTALNVACAIRDHIPFGVYWFFSRFALWIEWTAPVLLMTPFAVSWSRRLAVILLVGMHTTIMLTMSVGMFSWVMMAYYPLLFIAQDWSDLESVLKRHPRRRMVQVPKGSPLAFHLARLLARLDGFQWLEFTSDHANPPELEVPATPESPAKEVTVKVASERFAVVDPSSGARNVGAAAMLDALASLPLGRWLAWPLGVAPLSWLFEALFDAAFREEAALAGWLGLRAEGEPVCSEVHVTPPDVRKVVVGVREALAGALILLCANEVRLDNGTLGGKPSDWKPGFEKAFVGYSGLRESWGMFTADLAHTASLLVDAETEDGRHVDPYNEVASGTKWDGKKWERLPICMAQDAFFEKYSYDLDQHPALWPAFEAWILKYPERTHRRKDRIVRFTVYKGLEIIPPPSDRGGAPKFDLVSVFSYPKETKLENSEAEQP